MIVFLICVRFDVSVCDLPHLLFEISELVVLVVKPDERQALSKSEDLVGVELLKDFLVCSSLNGLSKGDNGRLLEGVVENERLEQ